MQKRERDLDLLFLEIKAASQRVNQATEELLANGRKANGELNHQLLEAVIEAQREWVKTTDWYTAISKQQNNPGI
ncbi:MAG: hypothetical protein JWO06_215 [Bacteroidota bacterium]|nr:hypothetical protein [Bacteroidota bacterium]